MRKNEITKTIYNIGSMLAMIETVFEEEGFWRALDVADSLCTICPQAERVIYQYLDTLQRRTDKWEQH